MPLLDQQLVAKPNAQTHQYLRFSVGFFLYLKLNFETAIFYIQTKISKILNLLPVDFTWIGWIPVADSFEQSFI